MPAALNRPSTGKILIVDDNALGLIARRGVLQELGHEIVTSSTPQEALELCVKEKFDVVVTDYKMPGMDGIEFIQQLRALKPDLPVILLSGFIDALGLTEASTGADAVIQKSSQEVTHLTGAVKRLLKRPPKKPARSQGGPGSAPQRSRSAGE